MSLAGRLWYLARNYYFGSFGKIEVPSAPHMDEESLEEFRAHLSQSKFYLEFGSGGSTVLADGLGLRTLTVESSARYARAVKARLSSPSSVKLVVVDIGRVGFWGRPVHRKLTPSRIAKWRRYCLAPFQEHLLQGDFPDFILVDGRFRRACMLETVRQALLRDATTTILFDDYYNSGRESYRTVELFAGPPRVIGRAALWTISRSSVLRWPVEADVADASCDFR